MGAAKWCTYFFLPNHESSAKKHATQSLRWQNALQKSQAQSSTLILAYFDDKFIKYDVQLKNLRREKELN